MLSQVKTGASTDFTPSKSLHRLIWAAMALAVLLVAYHVWLAYPLVKFAPPDQMISVSYKATLMAGLPLLILMSLLGLMVRLNTAAAALIRSREAQKRLQANEAGYRDLVGTIVPDQDRHGTDMREFITALCRNPLMFANNENENVRRKGERVWISWTNRPIMDSDGRLVEILCAGNDITKRKQAEEELRQVKAGVQE